MKKLLLFAMVAAFATIACTKEGPNKEEEKTKLSISATPAEIAIDGKTAIKVTASMAVGADMTVSIAVDKSDVLTVPASVVIKKGEKSASVEGVGKAEGEAKVTISCSDATISVATTTVKVVKAVAEANTLTATAPSLEYSTASGPVSAIVNLTITTAVDFDITVETGYNFDNWSWTNNAQGYPQGVTWSEYPVIFPANATTHSFSLEIEQGNAGTLPLILTGLKGTNAKKIAFEPCEFDFVITK